MNLLLWFVEAEKADFSWLIVAMELVVSTKGEAGSESGIVTRR
jgi:hypothetical protein